MTSSVRGFQPADVLLFSIVDPPPRSYPSDQVAPLIKKVQERVGGLAGVESAAFSRSPLISGQIAFASATFRCRALTDRTFLSLPVTSPAGSLKRWESLCYMGAPSMNTLGLTKYAPWVVNQMLGRVLFNEENSVGKIFADRVGVRYQIVGVCRDGRTNYVREPISPTVYRMYSQPMHVGDVTFEVKVTDNQGSVVRRIRESIRSLEICR